MAGTAERELEARQLNILRRAEELSSRLAHASAAQASSIPNPAREDGSGAAAGGAGAGAGSESGCDIQGRLEAELRSRGVSQFQFARVPSDYYSWSLESRRDILRAASVSHLCKSIVLKNTQAPSDVTDCSNPLNSLYYVVVVQYEAKLNTEKVRSFVHSLSNGAVPKKRYNMRLAPEQEANALTGFVYNAVTPVGMLTPIPIILSNRIAELEPRFFWMGGGEVDLKLGMSVDDFVRCYSPLVTDCT